MKVDDHKPWLICIDQDIFDSIIIINHRSMVIEITNFKEWKAEAEEFIFLKTSSFGYHIGTGVAANGKIYGKGTHVSVNTKLLKGINSTGPSWKLPHTNYLIS